MQAVPSLVGTGTVVAAAATGLVIGQSIESNIPTSSRPSSPFARQLLFSDFRFDDPRANPSPTPPPLSRPGTASALRVSQTVDGPNFRDDQPHPSPLFSHPVNSARQPPTAGKQIASPKPPSSRRQSYVRPGDVPTPNPVEGARDSLSSHSSWMRRLSLRPTSQHDNSRPSLGTDASFSYSQESGAPILSSTNSGNPSIHPNKLIKRMGTTRESIFARRGSKGQIPTIRRPATSHQRSMTAQQVPFTPNLNLPSSKGASYLSSRPRASTAGQASSPWRGEESSTWTSFFHMRRVKTPRRGLMASSAESSPAENYVPGMRIQMRRGDLYVPYLIHPQSVSGEVFEVPVVESELEQTTTEASFPSEQSPHIGGHESLEQADVTLTKSARRSFPTQFGSSGGWKARASSLRRSKRTSEEHSGKRRYASDPTSSASPNAAQSDGVRLSMEALFTPPKSSYQVSRKAEVLSSEDRPRECPSPIPPLSRLSSFHMDLSRMGPSPPPSAGLQATSPTQLSPTSTPFGVSLPSHSRAVSKEGASTLAGSEMSVPGLASGDDDTDYKSDAPFDSFRTTDTDRLRMAETPLDAMFDESFHGVSAHYKTKRLSIQEILGNSWDGDTRIVEEDEGSLTPMKALGAPRIVQHIRGGDDRATEIAKFQLSLGDRERTMGRLSLDTTDDDYDWARDDDDILSNPLSPPISSLNSRRGMSSPPLQSALARISDHTPSDSYTVSPLERPSSNLFDWAEPSHEQIEGGFSRPKTAHGKQELDLRGGRPGNRKGFPAVHVRSQSVPVVPDPQEVAKGATKFGTWAVGNKNTSEDWDNDFDFDFEESSNTGSGSGPRSAKSFSMRVPQPIQATQSTVKAHSGQIRELSLLVSSLKRLCRQGRDLRLLDGQAASLWKEAENIIALASPDEEEAEESDTDRSFSDFDPSTIDERFLDEGFDAAILDRPEVSIEGTEPDIPKNAVVKERSVVRRRSVFSPEDDIFGNSLTLDVPDTRPHTPRTPERVREFHTPDGAVVSSVIAAMEQQRAQPNRPRDSPLKPSKAKLFFDTNSLQELVKRAATVFHSLSDIVRREELLTMSPQSTPRLDRHRRGGSPAFTRVFTDPDAGSPRHLVKSQKSHSSMPRKSLDSNGLGQRMQMMTVS